MRTVAVDVRVWCSRAWGVTVSNKVEATYAGPCDRGVCAANLGHAGTCAEASGWDDDLHGPHAEAVITAELVACTLGVRSRPELQLDMSAQIALAYKRLA